MHRYARFNNGHGPHGPKRQLLGNQAQQVPPAWRPNVPGAPGFVANGSLKGKEVLGSKIFISNLPNDVGQKEVDELFRKTVGPLKESFIVYNSQGNPKGMAVVTFQRPGDAVIAQTKYHGKIVDGRRPIKIEIMIEGAVPGASPPTPLTANTLLNRIAPAKAPTEPRNVAPPRPAPSNVSQRAAPIVVKPVVVPPRRVRQKKGPKRLKKRVVTTADLDQEMDDYRASAPTMP